MAIKIELSDGIVKLPLNKSMGGIRIADKNGNHVSSPTKQKNDPNYFVEWMITNDEIKAISNSFFDRNTLNDTIESIKSIDKFAEESEYSKRKTVKVEKEKVQTFEGFEIYQYTENFSSFEKTLDSGIKVRITFKLGDYGVEPHPHMYVLIPFNLASLKLKNSHGTVNQNEVLGKGCYSEWTPTKEDVEEIIVTLAHASNSHRNALVGVLRS